VAIGPQGGIVVAGQADTAFGGNVFAIARLNANGMPDTSFGNAGRQLAGFGDLLNGSSRASAVAIDAQGNIVIAGTADIGPGGNAGHDFAVTRLQGWGPELSFDPATGTLSISGDASDHVLNVTQSDGFLFESINQFQVTYDGAYYLFKSSDVKELDVNLGDGNDQFTYVAPTTSWLSYSKNLNIQTGNGHNVTVLDFAGNTGAANYITAPLNINYQGGQNASDSLFVNFGAIANTQVNLAAKLGNGTSDAHVNLWSSVINSQVNISVQGGANTTGITSYMYHNGGDGTNDVTIDKDSQVTVKLMGGGGNTKFEYSYAGSLYGILNVVIQGDSSASANPPAANISAAFNLQPTSNGTLNASEYGTGNATMVLEIKDGTATTLNAGVNGGGNDQATITPNVSADPNLDPSKVTVDVPWI
jgi:hypothetical protein